MAQIVPTRRTLIGAVGIAVVAAAAAPTSAHMAPAGTRTLFAARLAAWKEANARLLHAANVTLPDDQHVDALCDAAGNANWLLLRTPAPDAPALLEKIVALTDWAVGADIPSETIEALGREASAILATHREA
ncbi:hypothetical protein [Sphingomonas adhaesiva]|uniref:hypothetical protein n=1 Tax=Sphingomonas adhaesiva TaxID=28212 RepID=UPI002FF5AD2B